MKRLMPYLLSFAYMHFAYMHALIADTTQHAELLEKQPLNILAEYNQVGRAKFSHPRSQHNRHLNFAEGKVIGRFTHRVDELREMSLGIGYMQTHFHFSRRPRFHQQHFDNLLLTVCGATKEIEKWVWDANLGLQINTEHISLSRYTFITGLLQGCYAWHTNRNLYTGIIACTGLRYTRALPIVGMDYTVSEKWKLNLVFPQNISAIYSFNKNWSVDAALRYFLSRQRLKSDDEIRRGFVAYRNWGTEIGLNYVCNTHVSINCHIGESLGGRMRTSNHNDRHRRHFRLDAAPYFGLVAHIAF